MSSLPDMDDMEDLWDNSKGLLIPGIATGAAGAGLGAYLTSSKKKGETPSERRKRLVRNALIGAAAGTTAGAAIPAGVNMLSDASSGGAIGDTVEDLIANTAILGAGGATGYGGGTFLSDKILNAKEEARRISTTIDTFYGEMNRGKSTILNQHKGKKPPSSVKDKLRILAQASESNTVNFYDHALSRARSSLRTSIKASEKARLIAQGLSELDAEKAARKFVLTANVKASVEIEAENRIRRQMRDIGLTTPDETLRQSLERLTDKTRWSSRADSLKRLFGLQGLGEAGKIWGSMPTDSGKWKSLGRRVIKGGFPGLGLAAGGLLASNFI